MNKYTFHHCTCPYVVDGDTIDVDIDVGFDFKTTQRLRLVGIDAPEQWENGFSAARDFVEEMVKDRTFMVETFEKDSFGRWLAKVYFEDGTILHKMLLENKLAKVYGE
jgi:micrococcal nuclease